MPLSHTILIVEDEPSLANMLRHKIETAGFRTLIASDGEQGLAIALREQPDIILLDILLPKLNGLAMLERLRAHEAGKTVPVTILTNLNDIEQVNEAMRLGATDFLVKSDWDLDEVVQDIGRKLKG